MACSEILCNTQNKVSFVLSCVMLKFSFIIYHFLQPQNILSFCNTSRQFVGWYAIEGFLLLLPFLWISLVISLTCRMQYRFSKTLITLTLHCFVHHQCLMPRVHTDFNICLYDQKVIGIWQGKNDFHNTRINFLFQFLLITLFLSIKFLYKFNIQPYGNVSGYIRKNTVLLCKRRVNNLQLSIHERALYV